MRIELFLEIDPQLTHFPSAEAASIGQWHKMDFLESTELLAPSIQGTRLWEYSRLTYRQYSLSQSEVEISISIWASKYTGRLCVCLCICSGYNFWAPEGRNFILVPSYIFTISRSILRTKVIRSRQGQMNRIS